MAPKSKRNTSLKQKVYDFLVEAIASFELEPGSPLIEQEIAQRVGVSRTPVREALKELEKDGFVTHVPGIGNFVRTLTVEDVEEIFALREALEVAALRAAINRISDEELREVEVLLSGLSPASEPDKFFESDRALHGLIIRRAGNRRLSNFHSLLNVQVESIRRIAAMKPNRLSSSLREHREILETLKSRDFKACEEALRRHINNVKESTIEVCRAQRFDRWREKNRFEGGESQV